MTQKLMTNKKAFRDYLFTEKYECGIELKGCEVKSVRMGQVNFKGSFARIEDDGVYLHDVHISPYKQASYMNEDPDRKRRLLLHKKEIKKLWETVTLKRLALIPTKIYFNKRGLVKVELALGKGKRMFDKRETIKKRDIDRAIGRIVKHKKR